MMLTHEPRSTRIIRRYAIKYRIPAWNYKSSTPLDNEHDE